MCGAIVPFGEQPHRFHLALGLQHPYPVAMTRTRPAHEADLSRRRFITSSALAIGAATLAGDEPAAAAAPRSILVLGGTGFIGPHLVRHAVAHGHTVSIFTRGRKAADLPGGVERLVGDRSGQLDALTGRRWDVVIDDSATNPEWVRQSTERLATSGRYLFTSSTGVYYPYLRHGLAESDPVHTEAADAKDPSESFGTRKAQCEAIVQRVFGTRGLVVRPTYIAGPGDPTDRFTYWPVRLKAGGEVLAPGRKSDPVQYIDVRDLAAFMLHLVEHDASGVFNAIGPAAAPMTIDSFLREACAALAVSPTLVWIDDDATLKAREIEGMVPWILARDKDLGHTTIRTTRSIGAGLAHRPVAETVRDTLQWFSSLPAERQAGAKWLVSRDTEREMLAAWRKRP
jgi:2'-hydroxyisoflavone reductase